MREVDHVHDAEDERQSGRHQEQHDAELKAVQKLLKRERHTGQHIMSVITSNEKDRERELPVFDSQLTACSPSSRNHPCR
jgi:hypothetical protein